MTGHSSLKTFPQLFTVTPKVTDCCLKILFLSPNFFHTTQSCQALQGKQRTSEFPMGMISYEWTHSLRNPPETGSWTHLQLHNRTAYTTKKRQLRETRGIWKYKRKIPTGRTRRNTQAELVFVSMRLFLCLPLPQPCAMFPTAPPDLPITPLIVMFAGLSPSSCWNVQDSLQAKPLILWMLHLTGCGRVQAEHTLTHTLIWGSLWDTEGTFTDNELLYMRGRSRIASDRSERGSG